MLSSLVDITVEIINYLAMGANLLSHMTGI